MRKKVLIVASTMSHIDNFHKPYISELRKEFDVFTMAKSGFGGEADFPIDFEKRIISVNNFKLRKKIRKILEEEKFDIIFLNTTLAAFYVRLALKGMKNRPLVVNIVHGYLFDHHTCFLKALVLKTAEKFLKKQTDYIVTMNNEDFVYALTHKLCLKSVNKIMGMGINPKRAKNIKDYSIPQKNEVVFSFIGELSARKNQMFLIRFIKELKLRGIKSRLNLIGFGKNEEKYKKFARDLGVEKEVIFCGFDWNIDKYLNVADFYISASKIEGSPFNIFEAMQCGQVVISDDVKGAVDAMVDGENGVLYSFNSMQEMIDKFLAIKDDTEKKQKISKNALETAKKYQIDSVFNDNISLFLSFIDKVGEKE